MTPSRSGSGRVECHTREDLGSALRLMVITDRRQSRGRTDLDVCRQALRGGATAIQIRAKEATDRELVATANEVVSMAARARAVVVVNDRPDVALLVGAWACHLGPEDLDLPAARRVAGAAMILGASAGTPGEARAAERAGADYLGVGPIFATGTKGDAGPPLGLAGLTGMVAATSLPVVAVGGISAETAGACVAGGACGVAVARAAAGAPSIGPAVRALRRIVDDALQRLAG
ncbi:MAG: thiamine phosphate synthase [Acidobacteriota bacterium]